MVREIERHWSVVPKDILIDVAVCKFRVQQFAQLLMNLLLCGLHVHVGDKHTKFIIDPIMFKSGLAVRMLWLFNKKGAKHFCKSGEEMLRSLKNKIPSQMGKTN